MLIDALANRYGVLPSFLLRHGDTFDLLVMDVAMRKQKQEYNKKHKIVDQTDYDQDDLMNRLKKARGDG